MGRENIPIRHIIGLFVRKATIVYKLIMKIVSYISRCPLDNEYKHIFPKNKYILHHSSVLYITVYKYYAKHL